MSYEDRYPNYMNDPYFKLNQPGAGQHDWNTYQCNAGLTRTTSGGIQNNIDNIVRLASVKTGLFNPHLPSLRRIDRDDVLGKLADEHCRHTAKLTEKSSGNWQSESLTDMTSRSNKDASCNCNCSSPMKHRSDRNPTYEEMAQSFKSREPEMDFEIRRFQDIRNAYSNYREKVRSRIKD